MIMKPHTDKTCLSEEAMLDYLLNNFCKDAFERDEILSWIDQTSLIYVYETIVRLFEQK